MSKYLMAKIGQKIGDGFAKGLETGYQRGMTEADAYNRGVAEQALQPPTIASQALVQPPQIIDFSRMGASLGSGIDFNDVGRENLMAMQQRYPTRRIL